MADDPFVRGELETVDTLDGRLVGLTLEAEYVGEEIQRVGFVTQNSGTLEVRMTYAGLDAGLLGP